MPSMTSFSVEIASISFGFLDSSSLIVPALLGGVLRRAGEAEGVTLKDDRRLLHLVLGQGLRLALLKRDSKFFGSDLGPSRAQAPAPDDCTPPVTGQRP